MKIQRFAAAVSCTLALFACNKGGNPEEHMRRGIAYFDRGLYREAIVELRGAIQANPKFGEARLKLGDAYLRMKDGNNALGEYVRAADLMPKSLDAQLRAGATLLLAQRFEDARGRADRALALDPNNLDAQVLKGNALAGLKDFDAAVAEYEQVLATDPGHSSVSENLGAVQMLRGDRAAAESTFKDAVTRNPQSTQAHIALANYYWATQQLPESEAELKRAIGIDENDLAANRALGAFYLMTRRPAEAEPYFKRIAAKVGSPAIAMTLASYYVALDRRDEARRVLEDTAAKPEAFVDASVRLAALDAVEGYRQRAETRLREALNRAPDDTAALVLHGHLLLIDGKRDEALASASAAIAHEPGSGLAHTLAAQIHASADRREEAIAEYEKVLTLDRRPVKALIELSHLYLPDDADKAASYARQALTLEPGQPMAQSLLARASLRLGRLRDAQEIVATLQRKYPNTSEVFNLMALVQTEQKQSDAARTSYTKALQIDPKNLESLAGLTTLDLGVGRRAEANARVAAAVAQGAPSTDLLMFAGRTYLATGDIERAETTLEKAIESDPARLQGYSMLGELYARQNRLGEARDRFETALKKSPESVSVVTMLGMVFEAMGKPAEAEKQYQRALAIDSRAAVASNNLAWMYAAANRNLDQALQLAQTAHQALPDSSQVSDTLGWVYVRKQMASLGLPHLESAVRTSPSDPSPLYHLGIGYAQAGDLEKARAALTKALSLKGDFDGAADARKVLSDIGA